MTELDRWTQLADSVYRDPSAVSSSKCPTCGSTSLKLVYVVSSSGAEQGLCALWCERCLTGLPPGFSRVPQGADQVLEGDARIPDFRLAAST